MKTTRLAPLMALSLTLAAASAGAAVKEFPMDSTLGLGAGLVLETMDGEEFDLSSLRGERTLIVTWASW
jgi:hypothetical protein